MRESTVYTGDSRAEVNHSVWLVGKQGKATPVTSGQNFRGWSKILDQIGSWLRMYMESSKLPGTQYARNWSTKATASGFGIMKLRLSERSTDEIESSLSLTDQTSHLWRTPDANCYRGPSSEERLKMKVEKGMPISLNDQVRHERLLFPTPTAFDATCGNLKGKEYTGKNRHAMKLIQAVESSRQTTEQAGGGLNPAWVSWLMGLPTNWTEVED